MIFRCQREVCTLHPTVILCFKIAVRVLLSKCLEYEKVQSRKLMSLVILSVEWIFRHNLYFPFWIFPTSFLSGKGGHILYYVELLRIKWSIIHKMFMKDYTKVVLPYFAVYNKLSCIMDTHPHFWPTLSGETSFILNKKSFLKIFFNLSKNL